MNSDDDFDLMPVKPRGLPGAIQFKAKEPDEDFDLLPSKPNGAAVRSLSEEELIIKESSMIFQKEEKPEHFLDVSKDNMISAGKGNLTLDTSLINNMMDLCLNENAVNGNLCVDDPISTQQSVLKKTKNVDVLNDSDIKKYKGVTFDLPISDTGGTSETMSFLVNATNFGACSENDTNYSFTADAENFDNMFQPAEKFIDDLDFLEKCGAPDTEAMDRLARKSLYVKFDPLTKRDSMLSSSQPSQTISSLPSEGQYSNTLLLEDIAPSILDITSDPFNCIDINQKMESSEPENTRSIDSHELGVVERLLYSQSDLDEVIKKHESDWQKKYDDLVSRELALTKKNEELESKIKVEISMRDSLEKGDQEKIEKLQKDYDLKIECLQIECADLTQVTIQYKKAIAQLIGDCDKKANETFAEDIKAKELLQKDLSNAETNLCDAYSRIERLKQDLDSYKKNEDILQQSINEQKMLLQKSDEQYQKLRQHASEKIDSANAEISKVTKQKEIDLFGLQTALKRSQQKINNLELELQQKSQENKDLSQICDDLIKKVSG